MSTALVVRTQRHKKIGDSSSPMEIDKPDHQQQTAGNQPDNRKDFKRILLAHLPLPFALLSSRKRMFCHVQQMLPRGFYICLLYTSRCV